MTAHKQSSERHNKNLHVSPRNNRIVSIGRAVESALTREKLKHKLLPSHQKNFLITPTELFTTCQLLVILDFLLVLRLSPWQTVMGFARIAQFLIAFRLMVLWRRWGVKELISFNLLSLSCNSAQIKWKMFCFAFWRGLASVSLCK